jgi:hypothetical protein
MKTRKSRKPVNIMKILSPLEQKVLRMARRHRSEISRCMKRLHALGSKTKHSLLIAACAGGLVAGTTSVQATEARAVSAPALFNEANAAQRAGRLGPAILDYERASLLAPHDPAIAQNLRAAREKAGVSAPAIPAWQRPAHWLTFNGLAALASISLLLFSVLFFGTRFIPTTLRGLARGAATSLGGVALLAASATALRWPELNRAVIVGAQPAVRIAPAANAAPSFELKPGEIVRAENTYGSFVRIRAADGRSGWVASAEVEKILPTNS